MAGFREPDVKIGSAVRRVDVTIKSGQQFAETALPMGEYSLMQVLLPAAFTGTALNIYTAADEPNPEAADSTPYQQLKDQAGTAVSLTVAAGDAVAPTGDTLLAIASSKWILLQSDAPEGADRVVTVILKG